MADSLILPPPRSWGDARPLNWAIAGPGGIAERFAIALRRRTSHRIVAVGSRSIERADEFANRFGIDHSYDDHGALVEDPDIDAVYVAVPHSAHADLALRAIAAGKHVLVEKPLATTAAEARKVLDAARSAGVLAMEAMWTRYLPQADLVRRVRADGLLGEVTHVAADFGFAVPVLPTHRLFDPGQAGGALLDAGVYPVSFISSVLGAPGHLDARGTLAETGVDDHAVVTFDYGSATAVAATSLRSWMPTTASISGTHGRIDVGPPFYAPSRVTLTHTTDPRSSRTAEWQDTEFASEPYDALSCEAAAFARFVSEGRTESPVHPHDEVIAIIDALDRARRLIERSRR